MAHLKKDDNGHLMKGSRGHLVINCYGVSYNTCDGCDPGIPDVFYATFAGLQGDFAIYNGKTRVEWVPEILVGICQWSDNGSSVYDINPPCIVIEYRALVSGKRRFVLDLWTKLVPIICRKTWATLDTFDRCKYDAPYYEWVCNNAGCDDLDSCTDSVGATCVISAT